MQIEGHSHMNLEEAIGKELRFLRTRKQMSQEELAFAADVHRTYVSLMERGLRNPTLSVLVRLCHELDISPDKFVKQVLERHHPRKV
jgi:transcriptional regulator with XRE-family HTH domain